MICLCAPGTGQRAGRNSVFLEELHSTVSNSADNARQAISWRRKPLLLRSGVDGPGRTIGRINESSRKIFDIISVIDGITNILALNAAVEAARAGVAVVASEVRSLAAEAAKEIKTLINAGRGRVEQGAALVDQAGGAP